MSKVYFKMFGYILLFILIATVIMCLYDLLPATNGMIMRSAEPEFLKQLI